LWRLRRLGVIVKSSMLVISDDHDRILPVGAVAYRVDDLRDIRLPALNVGRWVLVVFGGGSFQTEIGIHEGHLGQWSRTRSSRGLSEERRNRKKMGIVG